MAYSTKRCIAIYTYLVPSEIRKLIFTCGLKKSGSVNASDHVVSPRSWNVFLIKSRAFCFPSGLVTWWRFWLKCWRKFIRDLLWCSLSFSSPVAAVCKHKSNKRLWSILKLKLQLWSVVCSAPYDGSESVMHQSIETPAPRPPRLGGEFNIGRVLKHR